MYKKELTLAQEAKHVTSLATKASEDKKTGCQEGKLFNASCHPELCKANRRWTSLVSLHPSGNSGSVHLTNQIDRFRIKPGMTNNKDTDLVPYCLSALVPKKAAFTLAEVLITLGIIGVVAAITIPNMITNYQKRQTATKLKKVYAELQQVTKLSVADNGDVLGWDYGYDSVAGAMEFCDKYLIPYLKVIKRCGNDTTGDCNFQPKGLNGNSMANHWSVVKSEKLFLLNGTELIIRTQGGTSSPKITIDINGPQKPNIYGKDIFCMKVTQRNIDFRYLGYNNEQLIDSNDRSNDCNKDSSGIKCGSLIKRNNWKIIKDYPW